MRLEKIVVHSGDKTTFPNAGDNVEVRYTLWLHDKGKPGGKGRELDSTRQRGAFTTPIGSGKVVRGWDILVPQMSLGETAIFKVPSALGYSSSGFPGVIPPDADLVFEVELLRILKPRK